MEAAASGAADLLSPPEADWPPDLRLPARPAPPPPPAQASHMDDSQFLGSIMGDSARQGPAEPPAQHLAAPVVGPKKRGRPPKRRDGSAAVVAAAAPAKPAAKRGQNEEEVVCFICFDGGNLVLCDRRGCPKVYHPACIKRDESFFNSRTKWNCGWHICSSCEKAVHYMCYTCTYSLCKGCIKQGKFFSVRGAKGFCDTCYGTILLIESKDEASIKVDFDDINSWEYLFKLYWLDLKGKLSLTLEELTSAKSRWTVPNTSTRKEKEESSDDLYNIDNDDDVGSDCSSRKRRRNSSKKKGQKRQKVNSSCSVPAIKVEPAITDAGSRATKVPTEGVSSQVDTKWASPELLEFVGHMRGGDQSFISQFDVQTDLLEYIKKNNLRDPKRKSQIICDARLHRLFRKARVAHFEMLQLLEMHFLVNETLKVNGNSQAAIDLNTAQIDTNGHSDMSVKLTPDKRRRIHRKMETEPQVNPEAYAAIDMHNVNLIYMRRSLMEDLIDDAAFSEKIRDAFVRIKISGVGQKQDMYRLVKVVGTHKVPEKYSIGKKTTNYALEILNLDKKEIITMDTVSNQDFTEEECNRLRQSMKCGLISRLKVGGVQEKAKVLQSVRVKDCLENEKQRLEHLRDRASETGRKKELRECVEKLQLLNNSEERTRRINEVLEVHVDAHMDPSYESAEEMGDKKSVGANVNMTRTHTSVSRRKSKYPKSTLNHTQKISDASYYPKTLPTESTTRGLRTVKKFENFHHTNGTDIPRSSITCEAGSVSSSVLTMSSETEPEKVWHYKDPSGTVQGPFTLLQLSKWTSYFPRDLRVWLTFESEERSLLLTEVLSKQQTVFTQTASVTKSTKATSAGIDHNKNSLSMDQMNALSPTGYSMLNSSVVTVQSNKNSVLERESVNSPEDCLSLSTSSIPPKYVHTLNSQGRCQVKNSVFVQSPGSPCGQTDLHHDGARGGCSDHHGSFALKSSIMAQMSCNGKSPLFAWSPSESRTASSQHDGSCLSSTTNLNFHDEHHSSVATAKPKCCAPATPIEDRGSSSPSGMLSHSERVPICSPKSAPSASVSDMCKDEIMNQQRTLDADTSNASVNQSPESKIFPVYSPDNQDVDHKFPSPTPRSENNEPVVDNSGLKPASPENLANIHSPLSGSCKMEKIVNQHNILEADASYSSANHYPQSEVLHDKDIEPKSMRSDNKEPAIDNSLLTVATTENLRTASASDTDTCKMEATMNQQTTLEEGVSNASINQSPHSNVEHAYPMLAPSSGNKEPTENPSMASASDAGTCKMEATTKQQTTLEEDVSNASINRSPHSKNFLVSFIDNQDIECAYPSPTPRSGDKEPSVDNSGLKSGTHENLFTAANASDACKMEEILDKKVTIETNASSGSTTPPSKVSPVSSPDNRDIEHESPGPAPKSENREPFVDNSVLLSSVPENETSTSASASDGCKMEMPDKKSTLETDTSNGSVAPCPRSEHFLVTSDNQDIQHEYPSPTPRPENIPVVDTGMLILEAPDNLTTKTPCDSADAFALPKLGPSNGKLDAVESDFKSVEEIIQNELYCESTVVTKENIVIDPSCGAESIDVSDVLESLMEQRSGTSYMHGTAALEDLLAASTEEEPQCSSPIALSPWGEPSYYQGDVVDSALWGIEDDPANDMWSLLSTTPTLQPSSEGLGTKASETFDINEVAVSDGISEFFQRGPMLGTENVKNAISGAATDWQLPEQVKSKPNDISASSVDGNRGIAGWQPSASENLSAGTASGTSHNLYLPGCEKASRKQESTDFSVSWSGEAIGNTNKSWNPPSVNANRGNQKNHRRGRYSEISESWLLSSTNSRSRSDRFGNGGSSRPTLNGQSRGVCKFNEGGYCRKGASCSYLHP